jgi:hypothetical protein
LSKTEGTNVDQHFDIIKLLKGEDAMQNVRIMQKRIYAVWIHPRTDTTREVLPGELTSLILQGNMEVNRKW